MLDVRGLTVEFDTPQGVLRAADRVSFSVAPGEVVGIVGESGSGKSVTAQTILRLLPSPPARIVEGSALFEGRDLLTLPPRELRRIRGGDIGLVLQEPMAALNPLLTVGRLVAEAIEAHQPGLGRKEVRRRTIELLDSVQVPRASERVKDYPHQFSGGMAQRVAIAIAIANAPRLLIADEPTTALDVTVQAQVLRTLRAAQRESGAAMILITHDLAVIAEYAHRVIVMYAGRVVEEGDVESVFFHPTHPYTIGLLASLPRLDVRARRLVPVRGQPPQLQRIPPGCAFHPRCDLFQGREPCTTQTPPLRPVGERGQRSACHFAEEVGPVESVAAEGAR